MEILFPETESAGILFVAERAYSLDESSIEWLGEASGKVEIPEDSYVGIVFNNDVKLRRKILRELDLSLIQLLYFHNPFDFIFDHLVEDLSRLERAVFDCHANDEDCAVLSSLHGLRALNLTESNISDEGVKMLCEIQSLESLVLSYTSVSDPGLRNLPLLIDLRELDLSLTMITDAGLKNLGSMKRLEELRLSATGISDDCIEFLSGLSNLLYLDLSETAVSESGLEYLQEKLSSCQIGF